MTKGRVICGLGLIAAVFFAVTITSFVLFPKSKVTRENFLKLRIGMTQAEVTELFGEEPEEWLFIGSDFGMSHKLWEGDGIATIRFDRNGGGLRTKCWTEPGFSSSTKEGVDHVEIGMTLAQATATFGRKHDHSFGTTYAWRDIDGIGELSIGENGVEKKWWSGGAPQYRDDRGVIPSILRRLNIW